MNIKAIEKTYNWKPEDGDFITPDENYSSLNKLAELLSKLRLFGLYKKILTLYFKYF